MIFDIVQFKAAIKNVVGENKQITLFSPFIKLEALKSINASNSIRQIVVAWHIEDLIRGVSDLELYHYCKANEITLYRNTRIHLKVIWDGKEDLILGSANITGKGLGLVENHNFELSALYKQIDFETINYLNKIINESELVTDELYSTIKDLVEINKSKFIPIEDLPTEKKKVDFFLLSKLPQSYSPEHFLEVCKNPGNYDDLEIQCASFDFATYDFDQNAGEITIHLLREKFSNHPLIAAFKAYIIEKGSERYGGCIQWIRKNCTDVPMPRSFEIKKDGVVNILYRWICYFDDDFEISQPNYSEIIQYRNKENTLENVIQKLRRDSARGHLAPHQIILLIALKRHIDIHKEKIVHINSLSQLYLSIWDQYKFHFRHSRPDIVMPLKALQRAILIDLNMDGNFSLNNLPRNYESFKSQISHVTIKDEIYNLLAATQNAENILANVL